MSSTAITIKELQDLEVPVLIEMLTHHTTLHIQLLRSEGLSSGTKINKESIKNIQTVIELKLIAVKTTTGTGLNVSFSNDTPPIENVE
jgi:hypothetical protein